jgi:hypothetical protein
LVNVDSWNSAKGLQGIMPTWVSGGGGNGRGGRERGWSGAGRRASLLAWSLPPSLSSVALSTMSPATTPTPATSSWSTPPRPWSPGRRYPPPRGHPTGGITNNPPYPRRAGLGRRHHRRPGRSARCRSPFVALVNATSGPVEPPDTGLTPEEIGDELSRPVLEEEARQRCQQAREEIPNLSSRGRARPRPRAARRRPRTVRWRPRGAAPPGAGMAPEPRRRQSRSLAS